MSGSDGYGEGPLRWIDTQSRDPCHMVGLTGLNLRPLDPERWFSGSAGQRTCARVSEVGRRAAGAMSLVACGPQVVPRGGLRSARVPSLRLPWVVAALQISDESLWVLNIRRDRAWSVVAGCKQLLVVTGELLTQLARCPGSFSHAVQDDSRQGDSLRTFPPNGEAHECVQRCSSSRTDRCSPPT